MHAAPYRSETLTRSLLLLKALEAAREAASIIHRHYLSQVAVRTKADGSPVTLAWNVPIAPPELVVPPPGREPLRRKRGLDDVV